MKARNKLLKQQRSATVVGSKLKQWIEAARLWRELSKQIEAALVIGYDDWLKELPRAIRGEASPEHGAEFASKVLDLYRPDATARRIYDELVDSDSLWTSASVKSFRSRICQHHENHGRDS